MLYFSWSLSTSTTTATACTNSNNSRYYGRDAIDLGCFLCAYVLPQCSSFLLRGGESVAWPWNDSEIVPRTPRPLAFASILPLDQDEIEWPRLIFGRQVLLVLGHGSSSIVSRIVYVLDLFMNGLI